MIYTNVEQQTSNFDKDRALYVLQQLCESKVAKMPEAKQEQATQEMQGLLDYAASKPGEWFEGRGGRSMDLPADAQPMAQELIAEMQG